jgi:hypothetical protein
LERRLDRDVVSSLRAYESASGEFFAIFAMDALFRGDMMSRYKAYQLGTQSWMTRNEARVAEGKNPIDGLDEPLVPVNMETVSQAQKRSAANIAAKTAGSDSPTDEDDAVTEDNEEDAGSAETPGNDGPAEDSQNASLHKTKLRALAIASAGRVVRREVKVLRRLAIKSQDGTDISGEVWDFYNDLVPVVMESLAISSEQSRMYCHGHSNVIVNAKAASLDMAIDRIEEEEPVTLANLVMGERRETKNPKSERGVLIS